VPTVQELGSNAARRPTLGPAGPEFPSLVGSVRKPVA